MKAHAIVISPATGFQNANKTNIIFSAQINHNAINLTKFMCKYSKMDMDNKYNQIIKLTLVKMRNLSRNNKNKKIEQ